MTEPSQSDTPVHQFPSQTIDLPANLTEARLDGRACIRCGDEHSDKQPVADGSEQCAQLFEYVDVETCARRISQLRLMGL
jgi:hypothetical protein